MLKNILILNGAQQLSKNEQQSISGGKQRCWQYPNGGICICYVPGAGNCPVDASDTCPDGSNPICH